ncbi:MAG TPA: arylsulfatase [Planctomycetaceae bacterium]|nr:arylsulfatase [Planctomycetaceae bacterium]
MRLFVLPLLLLIRPVATASEQPPNILLILADDLGYGDLSCYSSESKIKTPHLDRLAALGMRFTDAHSPSTVCTPSRYSLMTGRMCFRTGYRGVFTGVGGPSLIDEGRLTLPQMLKDKGYHTACIGKWHIGMTFQTPQGKPAWSLVVESPPQKDWRNGGAALERVRRVDFSKPVTDGPIHRGFDRFFGTACCPTTDWLYAFIDQDRVPVPPKKQLDHGPLPKHPYAYDNRRGLIAPDFDLEEVDLLFLKKSQEFLHRHKSEHSGKPFFLFHSMQAVHLPSFPAAQFKGATQAGPHGDFIHELDVITGRLLKTIDDLGYADNTLVIFGSDNGPEVTSVINMRKDHQHDGAHPWRGMKRDQWEGGHRTPFIVRWPGQVKPGSVSDAMVNLTDVMATCAAAAGANLPNDAAEDSYNLLPVLKGDGTAVRSHLLTQTISLGLSIRTKRWKLLDHKGSGGNNYSRDNLKAYAIEDTDSDAPGQLYDLKKDPGETRNVYSQYPEIVAALREKLQEYKSTGRSAPVR